MNGPYPKITNISFLAKLFFKTFISLKHLSEYRTVGLSDYSYGPDKIGHNVVYDPSTHPSIVEIKNHVDIDNNFNFQNITAERVEKIINTINIIKSYWCR